MAQFTNQASISYNGIVANSNIVTGEITQVINVRKDATVERYSAGDLLTYVINIRNAGAVEYAGLTATVNLGEYSFGTGTVVPLTYTGDPVLYYINGFLQATPVVTAGPPLVLRDLRVPAGGSSVVVYRARVNEYAPLGIGGKIESVVSISGSSLPDPVEATETVLAETAATLSILKSLNPVTVVKNGQLSYTFTLQNTGATPADADAQIVVSDLFDPTLNVPLAVTLNGAVWTQVGNYTYDPSAGRFATVAGRVTVPAATYEQDAATGVWTMTPGISVITVAGNI